MARYIRYYYVSFSVLHSTFFFIKLRTIGQACLLRNVYLTTGGYVFQASLLTFHTCTKRTSDKEFKQITDIQIAKIKFYVD